MLTAAACAAGVFCAAGAAFGAADAFFAAFFRFINIPAGKEESYQEPVSLSDSLSGNYTTDIKDIINIKV